MENEPIKQKFSIWMKLILVLLGLTAISSLLGMAAPYQFGPIILSGIWLIILKLIMFGISAAAFYGIIKRFEWARKLTIGWYIYLMAISLVSLISFFVSKSMHDYYYYQLVLTNPGSAAALINASIAGTLIVMTVCQCVIDFLIIKYMMKKKDLFVD